MSREDVEIVRRLFEATTRRDAEGAFPLLDPEIEWDMSGFPFPDLAGVYLGRDEVFRWWLRYFEIWAESGFEIVDTADVGGDLAVTTRAWGKGRDGIEVEQAFVNLVTVRDGRLVRNRAFRTRDEALEAARPRE
jgi:ketosteroid isomerase-like protein